MLFLKRILKPLLFTFGFIIIFTLLLTILSYFNILGNKMIMILKAIIIFVSIITGSIIFGKRSDNKGWLAGIKIGLVIILILVLLELLLRDSFNLYNLIYYLIIIGISILGSVVGINLKKTE